jgi:hypothetical protein
MLKMINLPRQARDKHRESTQVPKEKAIAAGLGRDGSSHLGRRRQREGRLSARLLLARLQLHLALEL